MKISKFTITHSILCMISSVLLICSCTISTHFNQKEYQDDTWISQSGDSYSYVKRSGDIDDKEIAMEYAHFFGKENIWKIEVSESGMLSMNIDITGYWSDTCKICLVAPDASVIVLTENAGKKQLNIPVTPGLWHVVFAGIDASGSLRMQFTSIPSQTRIIPTTLLGTVW